MQGVRSDGRYHNREITLEIVNETSDAKYNKDLLSIGANGKWITPNYTSRQKIPAVSRCRHLPAFLKSNNFVFFYFAICECMKARRVRSDFIARARSYRECVTIS